MKPEVKLGDVDVMIHDQILLYLLEVTQKFGVSILARPIRGFAFNMSLIDNTLVIKRRFMHARSGVTTLPSYIPDHWESYKAATESVTEGDDSSLHFQLLRYKLGPLSLLVRTRANGTVQELPNSREPSEHQESRELHGINVITAGQGVLMPATFQGVARPRPRKLKPEVNRLGRYAPRPWLAGQTQLGLADVVTPGEAGSYGGLTVVEMGELVRRFEEDNQDSLRRLVGLFTALRDAVRAHGGPCIGVFYPLRRAAKATDSENRTIHVHSAGPDEAPVLLDWHKEHFWHGKNIPNEHIRPQEEAAGEQIQPKKSVIRRWTQWLGF